MEKENFAHPAVIAKITGLVNSRAVFERWASPLCWPDTGSNCANLLAEFCRTGRLAKPVRRGGQAVAARQRARRHGNVRAGRSGLPMAGDPHVAS